jgi:ssDNA thymidine ADP-ribosyltransferase, DarT
MEYLQRHGIDYLYHMTYIDNLASIIENGLLSHNEAYRQGLMEVDISDPNVQDIRASRVDPFYNRPLHEYVPLYFSPRNPMLYRRREIQEDIVILGLDPQLLSEPNIIFTNGNSAASGTIFYTGTSMLDHLPWNSIRARSWTDIEDGKRIKCAEVLVYPKIQPSRIQVIFCYSNKHRETIIADKQGTLIMGKVNRDLYF